MKKDGKDIEITPMTRKEMNLGGRKMSNNIIIIEKPVQVSSDGSVGDMGGGSTGLSIPINQNKDMMKKIQKVILQR